MVTNNSSNNKTGASGQVLQGQGVGVASDFSTSTYPSIATGTGTILRADGTNWTATTSTYPNTNAVSTLLYASSANVMSALTTANNSVLLTDASGVPSLSTSLLNDFTYTSSTAGATRTLTISNTNNSNTASQALSQITTGGASAGDPFQTFTISGATSFSVGLDNSASDAFVIAASTALGTTNVMSVATSGEINYPLQPAFLAYLATTATNKTGAGTSYTIGTDALTEVFDQNGDFNTNGTFTAPVTGRYCLNLIVRITGCTIASGFAATIVTSNRNYIQSIGRAAVATDMTMNVSFLCDLDVSDTATYTTAVSGEAGDTDDIGGGANVNTGVSGYLVA